jgi:hypothetical protein
VKKAGLSARREVVIAQGSVWSGGASPSPIQQDHYMGFICFGVQNRTPAYSIGVFVVLSPLKVRVQGAVLLPCEVFRLFQRLQLLGILNRFE